MSPSASLTLPPVTMSGEYIMEDHESHSDQGWAPDDFPAKQGNYLQGNYLRCVAEVRDPLTQYGLLVSPYTQAQ